MDLRAEMTATVLAVLVATTDEVSAGTQLIVLESMKMEIPVVAPANGVVADIYVSEGAIVHEGELMATISVADA